MTALPRYRIVIALDLSEYAPIVLEHALDQAARHAAVDLHLVTVVRDAAPASVDAAKEGLASIALEGLDAFRDRPRDWRSRLHVRAGKPAQEMVALAAELEADLIVVGRFGLHGRLGSVARHVIEVAPCPTLVVGLTGRPVDAVEQCPACVEVRAASDGERWFCDQHAAPDRVTLATTALPPIWTGGTVLW